MGQAAVKKALFNAMKRIASKARNSDQASQIPIHDPIPLVKLPLADMKESLLL